MAVDSQALAAHFARKKRATNAPPTATQDQLQRFVDDITKAEANAVADEERDIALATSFKFSFCLTNVNESSSSKKKKNKKKKKKSKQKPATQVDDDDGAAEKAYVSTHAARKDPKQQQQQSTKEKPSSDPTPVESGRTSATTKQKARTPKKPTLASSSSSSASSGYAAPQAKPGPTNAVRLRKATGSESELVRMQLRYGRGRRNLAASAQREHRKKESVAAGVQPTGTSDSNDTFKFNFVS